MVKMIKCKTCGTDIAQSAKVCPHCGAKNKKPPIVLIVIGSILVIGIIGSIAGGENKNGRNNTEPVLRATSATTTPKPTETVDELIINEKFDISNYMKITAELLYEYGEYITGEKVVTVITANKLDKNFVRVHTANGSEYYYGLNFSFGSSSVNKQLEEGKIYSIAGTVGDSTTTFGNLSVHIDDCIVVGYGEIENAIRESAQEQIAYCSSKKQEYDDAVAATLKADREEYVTNCVSLDYDDIARNPDSHKGEKVKFSGKVIQVSEGLLNSVTYRIATKGSYDNVVYVTHTRQNGESRILDGDYITVYGECDGVTSYMTILGNTVTVPEVKMKYYE